MDLLVVDQGGDRVLRYSPTGQYLGIFSTYSGPETIYGIDQSPDGNTIYVSEFAGRAYRYDKQGNNLDGGNPFIGLGNFTSPVDRVYGMTVDPVGNLHFGTQDPTNTVGQTHRFTAAGAAMPGNGEIGSRYSDDVDARVRFVEFDAQGNLWASQTDKGLPNGNQIYKFHGPSSATPGDLIAAFDIDASTTANPEAWDLSFGPSFNAGGTKDLYVAVLGGGVSRLNVYEGTTGVSLGTITLTGFNPSGVEVNRNNYSEMIVTSMTGGGSRRLIINGDGTYIDAGAFLVGGPNGPLVSDVPFNLQSLRFVPEPSAMIGMAAVGLVTLMSRRCRRR
jgi:hypothetical protein